MTPHNFFIAVILLAIFLLESCKLAIGLVQSIVEVVQAILSAVLFAAKIACRIVKFAQQVLYGFDWFLWAATNIVNHLDSSLEEWMVSMIPVPANCKPQTAIASLDPIAPKPTLTLLALPAAKPFPLERTAFECHAISAIASSLELATPKTDAIDSLEEIAEEATAKPLGKAITIGKETEPIPLSFPGVYVQRNPKPKKSKSELSKLTVAKLRDRIAEVLKNNPSVVPPKKSAKVKKTDLVGWLLANQ